VNIIFAGTPPFAATALAAIIEARHRVLLVLTQPDRPSGRGLKSQESAVKQLALEHQIPIYQPTSLKNQEAIDRLQLVNADVMVVAAYGLLLPESILRIPLLGCLNIHASLLPRWRGAAPIQRAILAGDQETGITIMQMDQGLDTGAMLLSEAVDIQAEDTTGDLHDRLANLGGRLIVDAMRALETGKLAATPQPEMGVTYAAKISKQEAALNFQASATILERKIRAFNPFPAASAEIAGITLKIWHAECVDLTGEPGQILSVTEQGVTVACGHGALVLKELQKPGGKRLPAAEFVKGFPMKSGQHFEIHS